jgi:hypothetical protein
VLNRKFITFNSRTNHSQDVSYHLKKTFVKKLKAKNWKNRGFEFLSIFIAVISAFALNNWNENSRNDNSGSKILTEINNGLRKDIDDINLNKGGHVVGISACIFFRDLLAEKQVNTDSLMIHYFNLTRDFVSIQNVAGYETLKSQGLELIKNDSLRLQIISLYEYDYNTLRKLEEEYSEMQFQESYFKEINTDLAPNFKVDENGNIIGIDLPLNISDDRKKILLLYLWKIQTNRSFILKYYSDIESKIIEIQKNITVEKR